MKSSKQLIKKKIYKHSQTESQIQTKFIKELKKRYPKAFIVKLADKFFSGLPDVMLVSNGRVYFYEIKSEKGVVSEIQKQVHAKLTECGAFVKIVKGGELIE